MEEKAETPKREEEPLALAALCYVPVMFVNWACILYILITKKDWKFGKFHAAQGAVLALSYLALMLVLGAIAYFIFVALFVGNFIELGKTASEAGGGGFADIFLPMYGSFFAAFIPIMLAQLVYIIYSLYVGFKVFSGKNPRIPKIGNFADGILRGSKRTSSE
jgi:uncharacterized membrane protein